MTIYEAIENILKKKKKTFYGTVVSKYGVNTYGYFKLSPKNIITEATYNEILKDIDENLTIKVVKESSKTVQLYKGGKLICEQKVEL